MPKTRLQSFLEKADQVDESLSTVKLSLQTTKGFNSFIAALTNPENLGVQSISELDLSGSKLSIDKIKELVKALNSCPNIKTLRVDGCNITDTMTIELIHTKHVCSLSLKNNLLKRPMFNVHLESLNLDNNPTLDVRQVLHYLQMYARKNIQSLSLNDCNVRDAVFQTLSSAYRQALPALTHLYLRGNKLTSVGVKNLVAIKSLNTLDLGLNRYKGRSIGSAGIESLKALSQLKTLIVNDCGIGMEGLVHVAQMRLQTVDLSYNGGLKRSDIDTILEQDTLAKKGKKSKKEERPEVEKLPERKEITMEDAFKGIEPNETLQVINLSFSGFKDEHAKVLRDMFPQITTLVIPNSNLSVKGVISLLENPNLQSLDVESSTLYKKYASNGTLRVRKELIAVGKENMTPLLEAICKAPELTDINLKATGLTPKMLLSLIPASENTERKLTGINGVSCKRQKRILEKEIADKKQAKELKAQVILSQPVESPRVELIEIEEKPKLTKSERIKKLETENARLKDELAAARAEISQFKGKNPTDDFVSTTSVKKLLDKLEGRSGLTEGLKSSGIFAAKKSGSGKVTCAKKAANESAPQASSSQ